MITRRDAVSSAVIALLASAGYVMADAPKMSLDATLPPSVANLQAAPAERAPLMAGLDYLGVAKTLDDLGINIYGYAQAGFYYDEGRGKHQNSQYNLFLEQSNQHALLNGIDIAIERAIKDRTKFDIGGKIEVIYGTDGALRASNGLNFYAGNTAGPAYDDSPAHQFAILQAYVDVSLPVGTGILLTVGMFEDQFGYETANPTTNTFYSHTYGYFNAYSTTQYNSTYSTSVTGIKADYNFTEEIGGYVGITRGWQQALDDGNDVFSYIAQLRYAPKAVEGLSFKLNLHMGPEGWGNDITNTVNNPNNPNGRWATAVNLITEYKANENLTLALDMTYGYVGNGDINQGVLEWLDVSAYGIYKFNKYVTGAARAEWYRIDDGSVDSLAPPGTDSVAHNIVSLTLGLTLTPFPDNKYLRSLKIRPEVRYDYSDAKLFSLSATDPTDPGENGRFMAGFDIVYGF
jgi:hypothetical protein